MIKHTQTIRTNCLSVFDHFVGLVLKGSTELIYLSLNKLTSKYGERIVLIFYINCIKLEESQSHHFSIDS